MRRLVLLFSLGLSVTVLAQPNRYFVSFKDKNNSPYSVNDPGKFLSSKSITRRAKQGVSITNEDLPVNPAYIAQVKALGIKTYFPSKWWNGVLVQTDQSNITAIQSLSIVSKVEMVAPGILLTGGRVSTVEKQETITSVAEQTDYQLQQLGLDNMHAEGNRGEGVDVAVFDSGWSGVDQTIPFQHLFKEGRIKQSFNFVKNSNQVYADDDHGTHVLSIMGALSPGEFTGGIYKANFYLFETEDKNTEYRIEEYNWAFAAERADSIGVDVINSSLGYNAFDDPAMNYTIFDLDGTKAVISNTARKATEKGIVIVTSAGNEGNNNFWKLVTTPADAVGVISVGSITSLGTKSSFSSIGPTTDGRIKPEVVALGSGTVLISSSGTLSSGNGTSFASPLVASLAVGLIQAFPNTSPLEIYQAILRSSSLYKTPNNQLGYGIPNFIIAKSYLKYGILKDAISVFPNPVGNEKLNILFREPTGNTITISVFDLYGKKLSAYTTSITWENDPLQYDLSMLTNGIYLFQIVDDKNKLIVKVVKSD